jgi:hypothetical protein
MFLCIHCQKPRREKSWDLLDQSAMNTARGMQKSNTHLTQAQVLASLNYYEKLVRILLLSRKYEGFFFIKKIHQVELIVQILLNC